jgi:PAS domain S-box-containing protein
MNPAAENLFGWRFEELRGRKMHDMTHHHHPDGTPFPAEECAGLQVLKEGKDLIDHQDVFIRKDGTFFDVVYSSSPLRSGSENLGLVVVFRDVSERKRAAEALRESAERFRFMAESMPQKIFTAAASGGVTYFNRQWIDFTGLSSEEMNRGWWTSFVHPDDVEETAELWARSVETGAPFQALHRFRRADGVYRWHLSRAHAMRDVQREIAMWIGSNTEIHEQKEIEEEIQRANEDLKQFAFAASHDLQEPLRMITSYSQLLVKAYREGRAEEAAMSVGVITEGTDRMRELLADLLAYTQLSVDGQQLLEAVDLDVVLREATENLKTAIEQSEARVTSEALPTVQGHRAHFVQLFQNLIENAVKYRREEPPRIHISAERVERAWRLAVADHGVGIAPEYHQQIFGVFKRLHRHKIPGTGIGLAICQRVVERYGGRIWVESRVNQGATFYFTLPAIEA